MEKWKKFYDSGCLTPPNRAASGSRAARKVRQMADLSIRAVNLVWSDLGLAL
jgi:hypothetical protein